MPDGTDDDRPAEEQSSRGMEPPADEEPEVAAGEHGPGAEATPESAPETGDASGLSEVHSSISSVAPASADESEALPPEDGDAPVDDQADADLVPEDIYAVSVPLLGDISFRTFAVSVGAAMAVFLAVFAGALLVWHSRPAEQTSEAALASPAASVGAAAPEAAPPDPDLLLDYEQLMRKADLSMTGGEYAEAVRLYRAACKKEDAGVAKVLFGRYKLSRALFRMGAYGECVRICESLRSVSRPGDELWKHALITSVQALAEGGKWKEFWRSLYLLRANSARYSDQLVLDRWIAYKRGMAKTRLLLARLQTGDGVYGVQPPTFGAAPCESRPLMLDDIVLTTGNYGDGTLEADFDSGELTILSDGASLTRVLDVIAQLTGVSVPYDESMDYPVVASLDAVVPPFGLEVLLGSVGLQMNRQGESISIGELEPAPGTDDEATRAAMWGLQEFMILYPESRHLPEAYYAFAHIYVAMGRQDMALSQLDALAAEFPGSVWTLYGHYVAGRAYAEQQNWERAEKELLQVVDSPGDHPLKPSAYFWAGQCQVEQGKYEEAGACFRRALAREVSDTMAPRVLYNIAYCLEKSGASALEVQERYLEVRTRYPETEYAQHADYRSARMALNAGEYDKAVRRYEFYLMNWPMEGEECRLACRDLVEAYVKSGDRVRAVLLGDVMCATFGHTPQYWEAVPMLLQAYEQTGLREIGLTVIDKSVEAAEEPTRRHFMLLQKARFLADLGRHDEAGSLLRELQAHVEDENLAHQIRLQMARVLFAQDKAAEALDLCRQVATEAKYVGTQAKALELMGQHYEREKRFDLAALAFTGQCPEPERGGTP